MRRQITVDICAQHGKRDALRRTGLSAAAETCCSLMVNRLYVTITE